MSRLMVVIPAAGESKRFKKAGYGIPKPLLNVRSRDGVTRSMLGHVAEPFKTYPAMVGLNGSIDPILLSSEQRLPSHLIVQTIFETIGQADTVYQMVRNLPAEVSVLVVDSDMVLPEHELQEIIRLMSIWDVVVAVAETFDPNASRVDAVPFPARFVEKEPISKWGIVGARGFQRADILADSLKFVVHDSKRSGQEPYLSTAINYYPGQKYAHVISSFQDWGTPERLHESGAQILD